MSKPIVVACSMDASFRGGSTPSPWHTDAVGGRPPHHPAQPKAIRVGTFRSGLKHDILELLAAREAIEIGGHHAPAPVRRRFSAARTVRRDQHVWEFVEWAARRSAPARPGLGIAT